MGSLPEEADCGESSGITPTEGETLYKKLREASVRDLVLVELVKVGVVVVSLWCHLQAMYEPAALGHVWAWSWSWS